MDKLLSGYPQPAWSQAVLDRIAALEADQHSVDGITITLDDNKVASVPIFSKPTTTANGKVGLVPAPAASQIPQNVILTAAQFQEVDLAFMHPTAASAALNKTRLDMGAAAVEGVNIDTLLRAGIFTANNFAGTLPAGVHGGALFNILPLSETDGLYYGQQLLISYEGNIYFRGNSGGVSAGTPVSFQPWVCKHAPIPVYADRIGYWLGISVQGTAYTLPPGYTWAYHLLGSKAGTGLTTEHKIGVAAGGTVIPATEPETTNLSGLIWRIQ